MGYPTPAAGPMEHEYDTLYRRRLLYEAAVGLSYTAPGGCLVLRLGDCLTMFTASVLYLLHRGFGQLALVKPFASCACSEERFVVCMGRLEDGGVAAGVVLSALRAAEELEGPGVGEVGLGADGLVAGAEAEAEATREDKVEGDEAGRLARDEGLRARGGQPAEREAGQMAGAGEEHDAAGEPGPGAAAAGGADARVPLPATEALVLAGVVPPSVCVCGPFYVYLAGRTQELARRQAAACEAAVRRAVAGAGKEGEEGAVACTPAEVQVEDAMARVRIVRQAEAALAEALDDGRRRAGRLCRAWAVGCRVPGMDRLAACLPATSACLRPLLLLCVPAVLLLLPRSDSCLHSLACCSRVTRPNSHGTSSLSIGCPRRQLHPHSPQPSPPPAVPRRAAPPPPHPFYARGPWRGSTQPWGGVRGQARAERVCGGVGAHAATHVGPRASHLRPP